MSKSEIVPVLPIPPGSPSEEVNETWEKLIDNRCQGSIESCAQRTTVMTRCWLRKDGRHCPPSSPKPVSPQPLSQVSVSNEEMGKVGGRWPGGAAVSATGDARELERHSLAFLATGREMSAHPAGRPRFPGLLAADDGECGAHRVDFNLVNLILQLLQ